MEGEMAKEKGVEGDSGDDSEELKVPETLHN